MNWPACPPTLKQINPILKIAQEHDERDIVVAYWARVYALQVGLKQSTRQEDEMKLLLTIMDWLEETKKIHADNEAITQEVVSQAHLENYAHKLFLYADQNDRNSNWNKNVVKAFYSSSVIYDIMQTFGELTDEVAQNRKYAKWKASYIHNCLKNGVTPVPGPMVENTDDNNDDGEQNVDAENKENANAPTTPEENSENPAANEPKFLPQSPTSEWPAAPTSPAAENATLNDDLPTTSHAAIRTPQLPLPTLSVSTKVSAEEITQAQKYCKYAASALNYDDIKTAVENLQSALAVLTKNA